MSITSSLNNFSEKTPISFAYLIRLTWKFYLIL